MNLNLKYLDSGNGVHGERSKILFNKPISFGYVSPQSGTEIISLVLFFIELSKNKNKTEYSFKH